MSIHSLAELRQEAQRGIEMLNKSKQYKISDEQGNSLVIRWNFAVSRWVPATGYLGGFVGAYSVRFSDETLRGDIENGLIEAEEVE